MTLPLPPSSPHQHGPASLDGVMLQVVLALTPALLLHAWLFGWGIIINMVWITLLALGFEAAILYLRRRPIQPTLLDGSALVTALLLAIILPPLAPWWLVMVATFTAIVMAKQLYGGLGYNPFNPAMLGYVVVLISFPLEMTQWPAPLSLQSVPPTLLASLQLVFSNPTGIDSLTAATPLDAIKTGLGIGQEITTIRAQAEVFGLLAGRGWEWINLTLLLGGLWLLWRGTIRWHIPVAMLATLFLLSSLAWIIDSEHYASPLFHLLSGGAILGAFFIATDPVTTATSPKGRIIFGCGVGLLVFVIRNWGGYPDGVAFAVLLMNMSAPLIDYYTRPSIFGHREENP